MLNDLKVMLDIEQGDVSQDKKLNIIIDGATARLKALLGGIDPPEEMKHIILEVSIIRFNRIGSEGMSSHSVEGENTSYENNDFAGFVDEINAYLDSKKSNIRRGGFRFL